MTNRNHILDFLKGIAIIAVVLYHWGISTYGYLGVDVFFVISGYLVTKSIIRECESSVSFSYFGYLNKRVARLWPGLILISLISLVLGWVWMLPLHFKLDCESVVGTILFGNNFVQYLTSGNYWMADNEYKPLMHTWYIGVLMQFYLIYPLVFILSKKLSRNWKSTSLVLLGMMSLFSLILYMSSMMSVSQNFYMLPGRFFELGFGGILVLISDDVVFDKNKFNYFCFVTVFLVLLLFGTPIDVSKLRLVVVVLFSLALVWVSKNLIITSFGLKIISPLCYLGVITYSLYLSHQVLFAFYRYIFASDFSFSSHVVILILSLVLGVCFYLIFEKPLSHFIISRKRNIYVVNLISAFFAIVLVVIAYDYYKRDGLVRDIPELDLYVGKNNITPEDYNSKIFVYDIDFPSNSRKNILVIGDSFGRDWINVMLESGVDSIYNISYRTEVDTILLRRIHDADYIFVANNASIYDKYDEILPYLMKSDFYRVGIKGYGSWVGQVYNNDRYGSGYYHQQVEISERVKRIDVSEKNVFAERYIDMLGIVKGDENKIFIFTPDNKLISQDCLHFTQAGAKYYAEKLDVWSYLK